MAKAIWQDVVIAESNETIMIEGNHYFPPDSIKPEYFIGTNSRTRCPWKGVANYYTISIDGTQNSDAAWCYPNPSSAASMIKDYVAFWRGVEVIS
ncbi:MAG: DUF427 domain-containing protein [Chloroflexota bacterium]